MRTFAAISAGGVLGILLFKLLATIFFPMLGLLIGILVTGVKLLLLAAVVYFVYSLIFKRRNEEEAAA